MLISFNWFFDSNRTDRLLRFSWRFYGIVLLMAVFFNAISLFSFQNNALLSSDKISMNAMTDINRLLARIDVADDQEKHIDGSNRHTT
jgi:hypothetical protein